MSPVTWNEATAAHLLRRAGYGGRPAEIAQAVDDGLEAAVARLVDYDSIDNSSLDARLAAAAFDLTTVQGIIRWWLTRILYTARPLEERMTFFWHDHFATGVAKVNDPALMLQQNATLRRNAMGSFETMLVEVSKDPAMLIWLDNWQSRKEHPNENYGRELLELFTLGIGNYSETEVMSAAKAFTGWTLTRNRTFVYNDRFHDHTQKDFLGRVGDWNGDDIIRIVNGEFATARLLARKLFEYFVHPNAEQDVVDRFAQLYVDAGRQIRPLVRAILLSDEMYSDRARWALVKSPLDSVAISIRQMEIVWELTRPALVFMNAQGLTPFNPPDVAGWTGGADWVNSATLLSRANWANLLAETFNPTSFGTATDAGGLVDAYLHRLGPLTVSASTRQSLVDYVAPSGALPTGGTLLAKQRGLAQLILSLPEWQLY